MLGGAGSMWVEMRARRASEGTWASMWVEMRAWRALEGTCLVAREACGSKCARGAQLRGDAWRRLRGCTLPSLESQCSGRRRRSIARVSAHAGKWSDAQRVMCATRIRRALGRHPSAARHNCAGLLAGRLGAPRVLYGEPQARWERSTGTARSLRHRRAGLAVALVPAVRPNQLSFRCRGTYPAGIQAKPGRRS
jgi:hypothetical protein